MITENSTSEELIQEINDTFKQLVDMISMLDNNQINQVPYQDSWTAGQLCNHVTKSTSGVAQVMKINGKLSDKNGSEKVIELKNIFLNFSIKMKSPQEIIPDDGPFEKQNVINELSDCVKKLNENSKNTNLDEIIENLPFGSVTKYELLHFVLYHSQRHLRQLKRIYEAVIV
ncbi:DinB family protein [Flavobacterium sp.]|uniref:DinB family protein n=1 Tax=Flavobacterium sp. TaxID=239 RepID=UPI002D182EA1|nr:DinB family protein [Flavobacterium sp.]HSD08377.1 DinB family protein [Flavobacterium sp.]